MVKQSRKYQEATRLLDRNKEYSPEEAVVLAKKMAHTKFDETVELHLRMGIDSRDANQLVRGIALLPYGLGKKVRVLVFAQGEAARTAETAGADYVGDEDLIKKIEDGWLDFDMAMATPEMMGKVGKLGKILGRKGLMPNPKSGTVVAPNNLPRAIEDARKGRVEFKSDRTAIIHTAVGKVSFEDDKLIGNLTAIIEAVMKAKPNSAKGQYIRTAFLTTTMGPGIRLDLKPTLSLSSS
ncbi:MAG: 50S ribosomal protein L1 [Dehalococcoidales bacterium]|nr:50S ribosomal protein L1 [Dehalococcoidales bacterium]